MGWVPWRALHMGIPSVTMPPARSDFNHTDMTRAEKESLRTLRLPDVQRYRRRGPLARPEGGQVLSDAFQGTQMESSPPGSATVTLPQVPQRRSRREHHIGRAHV